MMGGIHGKILHVDLTTENVWVEEPAESAFRLLVGGRASGWFRSGDFGRQSPDFALICPSDQDRRLQQTGDSHREGDGGRKRAGDG